MSEERGIVITAITGLAALCTLVMGCSAPRAALIFDCVRKATHALYEADDLEDESAQPHTITPQISSLR